MSISSSNAMSRIYWSESNIPDIQGKHFVVTGGNSGLGLETVRALATRGAIVTLACRDLAKGNAARDSIAKNFGSVQIDVQELDLASLSSIKNFAANLSSKPIDVLINNAGIMAPPKSHTSDGFELQLGTNHLGHFALTAQLWSALMKSTSPRVVTVSSNAHKMSQMKLGQMHWDDLMSDKKYSAWGAYAQSKLANLLFAFELQRRATAAGKTNFNSLAAHPGYSATNLSSSVAPSAPSIFRKLTKNIEGVIGQEARMGALPQLYAATETDIPGGAYVGPDGFGEWRGYPKLVNANEHAKNLEDAKKLWQISEVLTKVNFPI
jgi:NAD(P)-dependent dehydrogenase (short-subunit alcohol dehydrogenase family)